MLYETAIRMQQTDFTEQEAEAVIQQLQEILAFFDEHANHEDRFILPHIRKYHAQLADELENEHHIDHKLSEELANLIANWQTIRQSDQRDLIGKRMLMVFHEFIAFNLYHMNKEESTLLLVLWQHYSDAEIMQMERDIIQSVIPEVLTVESRWMMRAINNQEIIEWLTGIKLNTSDALFQHFLRLANEEIPAQRKSVVQKAILTGKKR